MCSTEVVAWAFGVARRTADAAIPLWLAQRLLPGDAVGVTAAEVSQLLSRHCVAAEVRCTCEAACGEISISLWQLVCVIVVCFLSGVLVGAVGGCSGAAALWHGGRVAKVPAEPGCVDPPRAEAAAPRLGYATPSTRKA